MNDWRSDTRTISRLLGDAFEQLSELLQTEIRLARAEVTDKAAQAGVAVGLIFGGCLVLIPALVLFLIALALFLIQQNMSPVVAHLIAGLVGAVLSGSLIAMGLSRLRPSKLTPDATIQQLKKDVAAARELAR